jgi:hypothetical protein
MLIVAVREAAAGPTLPRQGDGRHGRSEGAEQTKAATNSRRASCALGAPARPRLTANTVRSAEDRRGQEGTPQDSPIPEEIVDRFTHNAESSFEPRGF